MYAKRLQIQVGKETSWLLQLALHRQAVRLFTAFLMFRLRLAVIPPRPVAETAFFTRLCMSVIY
jgi:hypothetical protein